MRSDRLEELLSRTDAQLPAPPHAGARALAERVRARSARRAKARLAIAVAGSIALTTIALHWAHPRPRIAGPAHPTTVAIDVASSRAALARLDALAKVYRRGAEQVEAMQREQETRQETGRQLRLARDPLAHLAEARDRAARIMLLDADRLQGTPGEQPRAQALYRRAVQLFPDTAAAREAADRLKGAGA
ncbi:MAG TPA: hypothetical protein VGI81_00355 [Tepidisphaeraceae bacterium]|jgi:hypothetical protein